MAEASSAQKVLVTGASGFVATHIIKQLQEQGNYVVRGTVRSLKNEDKVKELKGLVPDATYPLELVEAELTKEDGWKEAVQDCTYVCHVASPFPLANPKTDDELIVPAVNGTLNVLKACAESGTVKRVVVTSSCASIGMIDDSHSLTEEDWQVEEGSAPYTKSKIRAERAAWDYMKEMEAAEGGKKFELSVVNPSMIVGPPLLSSGSGSLDVIKSLLTKSMPALPNVKFGYIDVRDVAAAHIVAMEIPEAAGERHILAERELNFPEVAELISHEFTPQGYSIPSFKLPKPLAFVMKFINTDLKYMYPQMGKDIKYSRDRMLNVLKIQPHDTTKSIIESCYALIESGVVDKTPGYLGPPESRKPVEGGSQPEEQTSGENKTEETSNDQPAAEKSKTEEAPTQSAEETTDQPLEEGKNEEAPEQPKEEGKPEEKLESKAEETPDQPAEESKPEETPDQPADESKPEETPDQPAEKSKPEETPNQSAEEAPEQPLEEDNKEETSEQPVEESKTEDTPEQADKEETSRQTEEQATPEETEGEK